MTNTNTNTNTVAEPMPADIAFALELFRKLTDEQQEQLLEILRKAVDEQ